MYFGRFGKGSPVKDTPITLQQALDLPSAIEVLLSQKPKYLLFYLFNEC